MTELYLDSAGLLDQPLAATLGGLGVQGIRVSMYPFDEAHNKRVVETAASLPFLKWQILAPGGFFTHTHIDEGLTLAEAKRGFVQMLDLIEPHIQVDPWLASQWSIEAGNEPVLAPEDSVFKSPLVYAEYWNWCHSVVRNYPWLKDVKLISAAPHNLDKNAGFRWLEVFLSNVYRWDSNCRVGIHRYIPRLSAGPHEGWDSREQEQDALDKLMMLQGGLEYSITETGITSGPHKQTRPAPWCWIPKADRHLTQTEQGNLILPELLYWKDRADVVSLYQLNSGPDPKNRDHGYGIRDSENNWKGYAFLLNQITKAYRGEEEV